MPDLDAPITTQEQLENVLKDRLTRERAKYADYEGLKAKAARLDELEAAKQTEDEKTLQRLSDMENRVTKAEQEALRLRIATAHGITDADDIALYLTGADEDTLARQAKGLAEKNGARATREAEEKKKSANRVPKEGTKTTEPADDQMREFTRNLFGRGDD
jgi:hypothetical protein